MKKLAPLLLVLLGNTASQTADQGIIYDCDTASGHFSSLVLPVPSGGFNIHGKVQVRTLAEVGKWAPLTRLTAVSRLADASDSPTAGAGFMLQALPAKMVDKRAGKGAVQFLQWEEHKAGSRTESEPFGLQPAMQELAFTMRYDGNAIAMSVGGDQTSMIIGQPLSAIRIICSTGEFLYTDLKITPAGQ